MQSGKLGVRRRDLAQYALVFRLRVRRLLFAQPDLFVDGVYFQVYLLFFARYVVELGYVYVYFVVFEVGGKVAELPAFFPPPFEGRELVFQLGENVVEAAEGSPACA